MKVLANKSQIFVRQNPDGTIHGEAHQILAKVNVQDAPDWIRDTEAFKLAVKFGSLSVIGEAASVQAVRLPPTVDEVVATGRTPAEAADIVADEKAKYERGEFPYAPRAPKVVPTVESLMAAGLTRAQAERTLAPEETAPKPRAPRKPKADNGGSPDPDTSDAETSDATAA